MADIKISQMSQTSTFSPTDVIAINVNGVTKKIQVSDFLNNLLDATQNLNDLPDKAIARQNLGVVTESQVSAAITANSDDLQDIFNALFPQWLKGIRFSSESQITGSNSVNYSEDGTVSVIIINNNLQNASVPALQKVFIPRALDYDGKYIILIRDLLQTASVSHPTYVAEAGNAFNFAVLLSTGTKWRGIGTDGRSMETTSTPINSSTFNPQDFLLINRFVVLKSVDSVWVVKQWS